MATVFSTATLGLRVDATQLNKELSASEKVTVKTLNSMSASAAAFDSRWKDLTRGIKDTKRIISGILISQGFYALMNAFADTSAAALEFAKSMETAGVSLEYFVDSAAGTEEAAAKVRAYLREVNEFAARTPFNTDQVLSLSKYMQAVGVSMNQTQSVLSVITDTAAATGADTEQLQRITFALGQMITKGRIANEEIRQLANANIPIYEILQEEMGLTGEQISNIGNYWVDASQAVVAILNGLNRRYQGAADRIAETFTGLTDTIVDDAKIIANTAFEGIYNKIVGTARSLRDTLDYWRTLTTEKGTPGLFNDVVLEIDPSGQLGNQILVTVGNIRELKDSFIELYHTAAPVLNVTGKSFSASLNIGLITLSSFAEVLNTVISAFDRAGIGAETLGKAIASLYITYKATKFMSLLGEAAVKAGMTTYSAASGILSLIPASASASMGIKALTASVAGLLIYLAAAAAMFSRLNNAFAGLENTTGESGLSTGWEDAYKAYEEQLAAYNEAVDAYRARYEESYTEMADGKITVIDEKDKDKNKTDGSGSGGSTEQDWVAAFDEVYDVPEDDGTGAFQDAVLDDLGDLLNLLKPAFKFPTVGLDLPEYPKFNLGDVYGNSLFDASGDYADKFAESLVPAIVAGLAVGLGTYFVKQQKTESEVAKAIEKGSLGDYTVRAKTAKDVATLVDKYTERSAELLEAVKDVKHALNAAQNLDTSVGSVRDLENIIEHTRLTYEAVAKLSDTIRVDAKAFGISFKGMSDGLETLALLNSAEKFAIQREIKLARDELALITDTTERLLKQEQLAGLEKRLEKLGVSSGTATFNSADDYIKALDTLGKRIYDALGAFGEKQFTRPEGKGMSRIYDTKALRDIIADLDEGKKLLSEFKRIYTTSAEGTTTLTESVIKTLDASNKSYTKLFNTALTTAEGYNTLAAARNDRSIWSLSEVAETFGEVDVKAGKLVDQVRDIAKTVSSMRPTAALSEAELKKIADAAAEAEAAKVEEAADKLLAEEQKRTRLAEEGVERAATRNKRYVASTGEAGLTAATSLESLNEAADSVARRLQELDDELFEAKSALRDWRKLGDKEQAAITEKTIQHIQREIAELSGGTAENLSRATESLATLTKGQQSIIKAVEGSIKSMLPSADTIIKQTAAATEAWLASVDPRVAALLAKTGLSVDALRMTATKTVTALNGISDWSVTFPQLVAETFKKAGSEAYAKFLPGAMDPENAFFASRGVQLEKYAVAATDVKLSADKVTVYQGGHAARDGSGLIVQFDAAIGDLSKVITGAPGLIAADVKAVTDKTIKAMQQLAEPVSDGIYKANANILKIMGRNDNFYELAAQSWVFTGGKGKQAAIFLNTDFDFNKVIPMFAENIRRHMAQVYNNSAFDPALSEAMSGRIFSKDAYELAKKLSGRGADYNFGQYEADIIAPLFTDPTKGFSPAAVSNAINIVYLDYAKVLKEIDVPGLAKSYQNAMTLFGVLGKEGEQYLTSYAKVIANGEKIIGALDISAALKNYPQAARSTNAWLRAITRDATAGIKGNSVPVAFRRTVDQIVNTYSHELAEGTLDAAALFRARIGALRTQISQLLAGDILNPEVAAIYGNLAKAPRKYDAELRQLDRALAILESAPADISKLNITLRSAGNAFKDLLTSAATGVPITTQQIRSLTNLLEQVSTTLNLATADQALALGRELQAIERYIAASGGEALLDAKWLASLNFPVTFAGIGDAAQYMASMITDAASSGLITIGKTASEVISETFNTAFAPEDLITQLNNIASSATRTLVADLETVGFPTTSATGTVYPAIMQATVADKATGQMLSSYITTGDRAQDAVNLAKMHSLTNEDGTLSDVAKAWEKVTIEDIAGGMTIEQFWQKVEKTFGKGNALTGWNATGISGFDYSVMLANGLPADLFMPTQDIMGQFTSAVGKATGISRKFKLADAFEIIFGDLEDAAHLADADVEMARRIANALDDGTVAKLLSNVNSLTRPTNQNVVDFLKEAGTTYRQGLLASADDIASAAAEASNLLVVATKQAEGSMLEALYEEAAKRNAAKTITQAARTVEPTTLYADAAGNVFKRVNFRDAFVQVAERASKSISDLFSDLWDTLRAPSNFKDKIKNIFNFGKVDTTVFQNLSLDEAVDNWLKAVNTLSDAKVVVDKARIAVDAGRDGAEKTFKAAKSTFDAAIKTAEDANVSLYKSIIKTANDGLSGLDADLSFVDYIKRLTVNDDYLALYYDTASRTFKTIGDTISVSGEELLTRLATDAYLATDLDKTVSSLLHTASSSASTWSDAMGNIHSLARTAGVIDDLDLKRSFTLLQEAFENGKDLDTAIEGFATLFNDTVQKNADDITKQVAEVIADLRSTGKFTAEGLASALNERLGDTIVIMNKATGNVEFAGKAAAKAVSDAADGLSTGLGTFVKKLLKAELGTFNIFDAIGLGISAAIEGIQVNKLQDNIGILVGQLVSPETQEMFNNAGLDLSDALGDSVYKGIATALKQDVLITLFSNGIGSAALAATAALAGGPITWVGTTTAAAAGIGASLYVNATGGNTDAYKYYGNYQKAVQSGEFVDYSGIIEGLTKAGYSIEEATKAADEANEVAHQWYQREILLGSSLDNRREAGNINDLLHGTRNTTGYEGDNYTEHKVATVNDATNDTLRVAQAMGLIDVAGSGTGASGGQLTVAAEGAAEQLEVLKQVLGDTSLQLGELRTINGSRYYTITRAFRDNFGNETGSRNTVLYNPDDIDMLADALDMVTKQGISTGDVADSILDTINSNEFLSAAYSDKYGNWAEAQRIIGDFLRVYNAANSTDYDVFELDRRGATAEFLQMMTDAYEAISADVYQQVLTRQTTDSKNRNIFAGDTSQMIGYVDTATWGSALLRTLSSMGLTFADNSYHIDTAYGLQDVNYSTFATDYALLRENLAGVRVGDTTLADGTTLDISSLHVTAADAEILAQAGIQIQSDGTIAFMNAINEGVTGATRDMTLSADAFSNSIMDALTGFGISVDFDAGELHFEDFMPAVDAMSSALFKLPDNINQQLSQEMKDALSGLGRVTDSGFLQITNKSVLSGRTTIEEYLNGLGDGINKFSPQVQKELDTIGKLLTDGGADIQHNLLEWSDGIVVRSPINADQLTPEIEAAFEKIGITFSEQEEGLMMIISQTGEHLLDGISLVDTDKWNAIDASVREALESLGLVATEVGNQTMIDLNGVFDGGIANIVSLFVERPDLWDQIPESVRQTLEQAGIITGEQLLEIQKTLDGGLVEISDGWVLTWDALGPDVLSALTQAGYDTTAGLAHVSKAVTDADVGTMLDNGIVVYFDDLPADIKAAMGDTAHELEGSKVVLETATDTAVGGMLSVLESSVGAAGEYANDLSSTIVGAITTAMEKIRQLSALSNSLGSTGAFWWKEDNYLGSVIEDTSGKIWYPEITSSGSVVKYWHINADGTRESRTTIDKKASGGLAEGTTLAGELGTEMAILPDGSTQLIGAGLYNFPKGTQILNAEDTAVVRKYAGNRPTLKKFADGSTELVTDDVAPQGFTGQLKKLFEDLLRTPAELVAIAIKNAAAMLVEEQHQVRVSIPEKLSLSITEQTEQLTSAINSATTSLSAALHGMQTSLQSTAYNTSRTADNTRRTSTDVDTATLLLTDWADKAIKSAEEGDWDSVIDALEHRDEKVYYIGTDYGISSDKLLQGLTSKYGHETIKANASGGLVTGESLVRVGEFGKTEAILPLEQPGVMAQLGLAMANAEGATGTRLTVETLVPVLATELRAADEIVAIAIKNAATTLAEDNTLATKSITDSLADNLSITTNQLLGAIDAAASTISGAVHTMQSSMSSILSNGLRNGVGADNDDVDRSAYGGSVFDQALMTTAELAAAATIREAAQNGDISWGEAHVYVEAIREKHGYSGGGDGSHYVVGSASGSLVDEDALYRAGELGLKEAIIPLERPSIMKYVGSTIASYIPENTGALAGAIGMRNAGVTMPQSPSAFMPDVNSMVNRVAQSVLESVLPAMSSMSSGEEKTPIYVGTLIADDRGLKQLERKLYVIRQAEEARR